MQKIKNVRPLALNPPLSGANYVIYDCSYVRKALGVLLYRTTGAYHGVKTLLQLLLKAGWYMAIWKCKLKIERSILVDYLC